MNESDRVAISQNFKSLVKLIDFYKIDQLVIEREIFTKLIMDDIKSARNVQDRTISLLQELSKRGPNAFDKFVDILRETGQNEAASLLKPNDVIENSENRVENTMTPQFNSQVDMNGIAQEGLPNIGLGGHTYPVEERYTQLQISAEGIEYHFGPDCYPMNKRKRGRCLIINNIDFEGNNAKRLGSEADAKRLDEVFQQLHFDVRLRSNLKKDQIRQLLKDYAAMDHTEANAFIVIILSHGNEVGVYGTDGSVISLEDIYMTFNNIDCPTLKMKPKLFFIQACRGSMFDCGTPEEVVADAMISDAGRAPDTVLNPVLHNNYIPTVSDICLSLSTVQKFVSNRNEVLGSWYARALCDTLIKDAQRAELNEILSTMDRNVQSRTGMNGQKQATDRRYLGWNKKFYFNPGYFV